MANWILFRFPQSRLTKVRVYWPTSLLSHSDPTSALLIFSHTVAASNDKTNAVTQDRFSSMLNYFSQGPFSWQGQKGLHQ